MRDAWGHGDVSDESLTRCIYRLRKALEENGKDFIQTVYGQGYLLRTAQLMPGVAKLGVLVYPFACAHALVLQQKIAKALLLHPNLQLYPSALSHSEAIHPPEQQPWVKVLGESVGA